MKFGEILTSALGRFVVKINCWQSMDVSMDGQTTDNGYNMITKDHTEPMAQMS